MPEAYAIMIFDKDNNPVKSFTFHSYEAFMKKLESMDVPEGWTLKAFKVDRNKEKKVNFKEMLFKMIKR